MSVAESTATSDSTRGEPGAATESAPGQPEQRRILRTEVPGPRSRELQQRRTAAVPVGMGVVLPVFIERAGGGVLVDVDGNHLIDFASGIAVTSVGASAPEVVSRVQEQVARFAHTCFMVTEYDGYVAVAERLNALTPGDHDKRTALFTTGAEAVENAVKVARHATGRTEVVVFDHAYHGRTMMAMAMTAKEMPYKAGFGPFPGHVHRAPFPYALRWPTGPENAAAEALAALEELLEEVGPQEVAAIVVEPVQGEGGFIVPAPGFLAGVQEVAKRHGIVFVADEVQAGLGRTGTVYASEFEGIVPDLVCSAKALGGGLPLSAVTGRAELMEAVHAGGLGGTYAGNPVACAAALGALSMIEEGGLLEAARHIEQVARGVLEPLAQEVPTIAEVRGRGAMLAMEFVRPGSLEPAPEVAKAVAARCHEQGVVVLVCGTYGNVIRLLPPLVIGDELLADGLAVLAEAVREAS
ncbi:4-aminobutyrate--2-oxoglutarate transaminase [Segeticoccus rhizosphaerae]|jgi:4-aminobutyrate aminotransferase/(S)-3-amino-2-methylpropionate transaminase|uniref:4-aminobutyrate--2-oxoglutarate transaminase n=1 Tax=Segeticoccus rhizosphaerae TaxID=1104777 RepID=UPI0010C02DA4|nr:4-aminobutyrate--2-oxoglutarate transaminase [Ornithinicoccus soli]